MNSKFEKYGNSFGFWIFIVVLAYLAYGVYFGIYGLNFGIGLISDTYVHNLISRGPWWWAILYYGSEGLFISIAGILRALAGLFGLYAAYLYWRKKETALPQIKKSAGAALLLEAGYYLCLIPSVIAAFAYYSSKEYLFYFDHTPGALLLYVTGIPCLALVIVIPPLLLKLRAKIRADSHREEIIKWGSLAGIAYLFVAFWLNYSMSWAGTMVPYSRSQQEYGLSFLYQPTNLVSFVITVFGLFALAAFALKSTIPAIMKHPTELSLTRIGTVVTALGGYFTFNILYYYITGGYAAHPSVWYEIIGPLHNPDLWCVAFLFLGLAIIFRRKTKKPM
jgi:hypothetical protein